jgi:hypothetical protein
MQSVLDNNHRTVEEVLMETNHVDLAKAKDVVEHFGDYTVDEIQKMRDGTYVPAYGVL